MRIADWGLQICAMTLSVLTTAMLTFAQESPSPGEVPSASPRETVSVSPLPSVETAPTTPEPSASPSVAPSSTSTPATSAPGTRSARISFLPPPLDGTISLGIYDQSKQLVRVLHEEADFDEFTVGADALVTKWDGKNDKGEDMPPGTYRARGYAVGELKAAQLETQTPYAPSDGATPASVKIKLVANPLANEARASIELTAAFDETSAFLKTPDGLPLFTIVEKPNIKSVLLKKGTEKGLEAWVDDGAGIQHLRISNVDKMMAFDCGEFQLK